MLARAAGGDAGKSGCLCNDVKPIANAASNCSHNEPVAPVSCRWPFIVSARSFQSFTSNELLTLAADPKALPHKARSHTQAASSSAGPETHNSDFAVEKAEHSATLIHLLLLQAQCRFLPA